MDEMLGGWETMLPQKMQEWKLDRSEASTVLHLHPSACLLAQSRTFFPSYLALRLHRLACREIPWCLVCSWWACSARSGMSGLRRI